MKCPNCKKNNNSDSNFCSRCGSNLSKLRKKPCSICLETKKLETLGCGHQVCLQCIQKSYKIKPDCPECRQTVIRCDSCHSFRVIKIKNDKIEKCLDCQKTRKIEKEKENKVNKYSCLECSSERLLYNHVSSAWNCLDCFQNFKVEDGVLTVATQLVSTTTICSNCSSNNIHLKEDGETRCLNCNRDNIRTKIVSSEEFSTLNIMKPEENTSGIKTKKCQECQGEKYFKMMDANGFDYTYYCYTCKKSNVVIA